jgi:hypothetical protein
MLGAVKGKLPTRRLFVPLRLGLAHHDLVPFRRRYLEFLPLHSITLSARANSKWERQNRATLSITILLFF